MQGHISKPVEVDGLSIVVVFAFSSQGQEEANIFDEVKSSDAVSKELGT